MKSLSQLLTLICLINPTLGACDNFLWIGPHPDDEINIAPLLAQLCASSTNRCALLVLTQGEAGKCKSPGGCLPNLVSVRSQELKSVAVYLNAQFSQLNLGDGTSSHSEGVLLNWSLRMGGANNLINLIQAAISNFRATTVFTFDPRHGTTCHPDHRATAQLVIEAARRIGFPSNSILMVENKVATGVHPNSLPWAGFVPAVSDALNLDLNVASQWFQVPTLMSLYASQYLPIENSAMAAAPLTHQRVYLQKASDMNTSDSRYSAVCN